MDISILSHEIINPLNIVVGCAELSKIEADLIKNEKICKYLKTIVSESMKCCSLLKETLQHNKLSKTTFNILKDTQKIINNFECHPLLFNNNKRIVLINLVNKNKSSNDDAFNIIVDNNSYLKIIINNMIMNAIKHSSCNNDIIVKIKPNNTKYYHNSNSNSNKIILEIINRIDNSDKEKQHNYFTKSNFLGLNIIDSLVRKLNYEWNLIQDDNCIITQLIF